MRVHDEGVDHPLEATCNSAMTWSSTPPRRRSPRVFFLFHPAREGCRSLAGSGPPPAGGLQVDRKGWTPRGRLQVGLDRRWSHHAVRASDPASLVRISAE